MIISEAFAQDSTAANGDVTLTAMPEQTPYELSTDKMLMDTLVFLALLFGIFYFLLIRPQQRRYKQHNEMISAIKKGTRIVTGGGIIGTVHKLDGDDIVVVEIAPDVKVKVARSTIGEVLSDTGPLSSTANDN